MILLGSVVISHLGDHLVNDVEIIRLNVELLVLPVHSDLIQ